jgi:hypothetical protein
MIRAQLLSDPIVAPEPQPSPTPKPMAAPERTPLRLNRNVMNYPLARSVRTKPIWHEDKTRGDSWCQLPGDDRIELSLSADAPVRRCPTGFDMNLLFRLMAGVQQSKNERVEFASVNAFLRELHLTHKSNRARVLDSLELRGHLSIFYSRWYERGAHVERNFPPPVRHVDLKGHRVVVTLHREWVELACAKGYFESIPLPLPQEAAAQNWALLALTATLKAVEGDCEVRGGAKVTYERRRGSFCQKLGLRNEVLKLDRIEASVAAWFESGGGALSFVEGINKPKHIVFVVKAPSIPRRKSGTRRSKASKAGDTNRAVEGAKFVQIGRSRGPY